MGVVHATKRHLGLARTFLDYMRRSEVVERPHYFNIDPISACNLKCRMCPQSDPDNKVPIGRMPMELYERVVSEIENFTTVDGLSLFLAGEPLLHSGLPTMVRMAVVRLQSRPNIATNGMRLTREMAEELLDAGVGMFQIDFCADAEYFNAMAPPGKWEVVRDNLIGLFTLISSRSFKPLVALKDLDWRGETPQEREASLRGLRDVFGQEYSFVHYRSYRLHNWSGDFSAKAESHFGYQKRWGPTYHPCSHLWLAMNIHWNGNVSICCRDLLQQGVVGNIRERSLAEIWNGQDMRRMRRLMATKRYQEIPICRQCDRPWTGGYSGGSALRIASVYVGSKLKQILKIG